MSNYRRLISYIYAYEGGIKGKNIGFAKIETRGSQCKITVSVKKIYVGGNDIGVYLLAGEKEIMLGNIFIRGGSGEFRTVVSVSDVEHSGIPVDQCCGLTVHDVENTWRSYTTIWEDAVAHAAELELSNILPENKEAEERAQEARIQKAIREIEEEFPVEPAQNNEVLKEAEPVQPSGKVQNTELPQKEESIKAKIEDEKQETVSREQLRSFTENAREQSKAFAESIRRQVEGSADLAKRKAEAWIRQQESVKEQAVKTHIEPEDPQIQPVREPAGEERAPIGEPPGRIYRQEEPAVNSNSPVREPYRPKQDPVRMAGREDEFAPYANKSDDRETGNFSRSYTGFSGIPAVEYAAELMPEIENVPSETVCYRTDTTGIYDEDQEDEAYTGYQEQMDSLRAEAAEADLPEKEQKTGTLEEIHNTEAGRMTEGSWGAQEQENAEENGDAEDSRNTQGREADQLLEAAQDLGNSQVIRAAQDLGNSQESRPTQESHDLQEFRPAQESHDLQESRPAQDLRKAQEARPIPGDPEALERLLETEDEEENSSDQVWAKLRREHTKILDFDYEKGCEILTIKPQDIGLLPREVWVYGNNSFLLHGYYNYRYLILAKLFNPEGAPRYLLGVPGHYYSNERYMASMFGFPNFVLSKNQPIEDGRFGYWYTDIKIGN